MTEPRDDQFETTPDQPADNEGQVADETKPFAGNHDGGQHPVGDPAREADHEHEDDGPTNEPN